jgi:hypothetical protein
MGYYINPPDVSKEEFFRDNGIRVSPEEVRAYQYSPEEKLLPVCLVCNWNFSAAGIAYDPLEREAFLAPDPRPMQWFLVSKEKLQEFLPTPRKEG